MQDKENFVRFLLGTGALEFGDFTLKSGRKSPYMINTGKVSSGRALARLGCFYARAIKEKMELGVIPEDIDILFGSAYKGIPLSVTASIALAAAFDLDVGYAFNRKVEKDHGEGGVIVGKKPGAGSKVLVVDDVMTAGTALRDTVDLLGRFSPKAKVVGSVIAVDRKERGNDARLTAVAETQYELGLPVFSIIDIDEIVEMLKAARFSEKAEAGEEVKEDRASACHLDICYKDLHQETKATLPTGDQIAAIESYLAEHRPAKANTQE